MNNCTKTYRGMYKVHCNMPDKHNASYCFLTLLFEYKHFHRVKNCIIVHKNKFVEVSHSFSFFSFSFGFFFFFKYSNSNEPSTTTN